jgi:8-oxo-dGTP diphosphatase
LAPYKTNHSKTMQLPDCFYRVSIKGVILNEARDKFLICKESSGHWETPGGGLDWNTTPQEDLAREIKEEMGLEVTWVSDRPSYFLSGYQALNPDVPIVNIFFECKVNNLDITPSDECTEIRFVDKNDLVDLKTFPQVNQLADLFDPKNH